MTNEALTLYKLIILYMLNKVNFPLTNAQISGFFLDREYTTYFTLQQAISELLESRLIRVDVIRNASQYRITDEGKETLTFFRNKISDAILNDINTFLDENKYELRNEVGITADYYKSTSQDYIVHCIVKEGKTNLIEMNLSVPTVDEAEHMCDRWKNCSQEIYAEVMKHLLN